MKIKKAQSKRRGPRDPMQCRKTKAFGKCKPFPSDKRVPRGTSRHNNSYATVGGVAQ